MTRRRQQPKIDCRDRQGSPWLQFRRALAALDVYQRTLALQQAGFSPAQIRQLGGGASYFSISTGAPSVNLHLLDAGVFFNDDWRVRPNLSVSAGVRYETQTHLGGVGNWSPRVGVAWGIDGTALKAARTVLRLGAGFFYDRVVDSTIVSSLRYNGIAQQAYQILNPDFYPNVPSIASLSSAKLPQQLRLLDSNLVAPRQFQTNAGLERQINKYARVSVNYIYTKGTHLLLSRDINAPLNGAYPFGDKQVRISTESDGVSQSHQVIVSPNISYKKLFLFGFYNLSYGKDNNEGEPANPYNTRAEWGPSSFGDIRQRGVIGTSVPLPWKISVNPFFTANSGSPYNITTGSDQYGDGFTTARPAIVEGATASTCSGTNLVYRAGFGCFNLNPSPGTATISRNYGRGPASITLNLRLSRTWSFGKSGESGPRDQNGLPPGGPGGGGPPPGGPGGGGPPPGGGGPGGGGPPPGLFGAASGRKYNLTLGVTANNVLNHPNFAAPSGDLSSPYFGVSRSLSGGFGPDGTPTTYNRKISVQLRLSF